MKEILTNPWAICGAFVLAIILWPTTASADTYVEWKHKQSLDTSSKTSDYVRVGHKFKNNLYFELGEDSAETGFKKKFNNLLVKGKIESTNDFDKNGAEVEIRYVFIK